MPIAFGGEESFAVAIQGAGGLPREDPLAGALPLHFYEADRRVPAVGFDFGRLDDAEGFFKEAISAGRPLRPIIEGMVCERETEIRCELVMQLVSMLVKRDKKTLAVFALADACGLGNLLGLSQTEMARRAGVSKQDVQQLSDEFKENLGLRQTRTHRGREARGKMALANFSQRKKV